MELLKKKKSTASIFIPSPPNSLFLSNIHPPSAQVASKFLIVKKENIKE